MLFWGSQGLKRNIQAAVEYYKMGIESKDPVAMYDYGILMMRVSNRTRCEYNIGFESLKHKQ